MKSEQIIEFKWEKVTEDAFRTKVFGGWVFCESHNSSDSGDVIATAMVFIPDPDHLWRIK
jgi:hypothetical protein